MCGLCEAYAEDQSALLPDPDRIRMTIDLELRGQLARRLDAEAKRRGRPAAEIIADLIETVIEDDLVAAVLDR